MPKFKNTGFDFDVQQNNVFEHFKAQDKGFLQALDQRQQAALESLQSKKLKQAILGRLEQEEIHYFSEELAQQLNANLSSAKSAAHFQHLLSTYDINIRLSDTQGIFTEYMRANAAQRAHSLEAIKSKSLRKILDQYQQNKIDTEFQLPDFLENIDSLNEQFEHQTSPKAILTLLAKEGVNLSASQGRAIFLEYKGTQDLKVYVNYKNLFMQLEQASSSPTLAKMACLDPTRWSPTHLRTVQKELDRFRIPYVPRPIVEYFQRKVLASVMPELKGKSLLQRIVRESKPLSTSARLGRLTNVELVEPKPRSLIQKIGQMAFKVLSGVEGKNRQRLHEVASKKQAQAPLPTHEIKISNTHQQLSRMMKTM